MSERKRTGEMKNRAKDKERAMQSLHCISKTTMRPCPYVEPLSLGFSCHLGPKSLKILGPGNSFLPLSIIPLKLFPPPCTFWCPDTWKLGLPPYSIPYPFSFPYPLTPFPPFSLKFPYPLTLFPPFSLNFPYPFSPNFFFNICPFF